MGVSSVESAQAHLPRFLLCAQAWLWAPAGPGLPAAPLWGLPDRTGTAAAPARPPEQEGDGSVPVPSAERGSHRPRLSQPRPGRPLPCGDRRRPSQPSPARRAERGVVPGSAGPRREGECGLGCEGGARGEAGQGRGWDFPPECTLWPLWGLCQSGKRPEGMRAKSSASSIPPEPPGGCAARLLPHPAGTGLPAPPGSPGPGLPAPPRSSGAQSQPRAEATPLRSSRSAVNFLTPLLAARKKRFPHPRLLSSGSTGSCIAAGMKPQVFSHRPGTDRRYLRVDERWVQRSKAVRESRAGACSSRL